MKLKRKLKLDQNGKKLECILFTSILGCLYTKFGRDIKGYKNYL